MLRLLPDEPRTENKRGQMEYRIDCDELMHLREIKVINTQAFVFMALTMTYSQLSATVDIEDFCEMWILTESELISAIAALQKKGVLRPRSRQLEIEFTMEPPEND